MSRHYPVPVHQSDDQDGHELHRTDYAHSGQPATRPDNQNAFGDDSDSEEQDQFHNPQPEDHIEFDAYKDFNNTGVRYVTLLNNADEGADYHDDERSELPASIHNPRSPLRTEKQLSSSANHFPELAGSLASHQSPKKDREVKFASGVPMKADKFRKRRPRGGWRVGAIVAFIALALLGVAIFFLMPRQPFISYETPIVFVTTSNSSAPVFSSQSPTKFSFEAQLQLSLDGRTSYLPTRMSHIEVIVSDLGSTTDPVRVGKGTRARALTVSPRQLTPVALDVQFEYTTRASTDALWQAWHHACGNIGSSTVNGTVTRPALQLYIAISFQVTGMIGTKSDSAQIAGVSCPIELPASNS